MILIKNAQVFAPKALGKKDVLLAYDKILEIADCIEPWRDDLAVIDAAGKMLVPGFIDQHVHIVGGGGEGGFETRTPEFQLSKAVTSGVTTLVGLLGTDGYTKSPELLLAKTKALNNEGITAYCLTNSYAYPPRTITGSVANDILQEYDLCAVFPQKLHEPVMLLLRTVQIGNIVKEQAFQRIRHKILQLPPRAVKQDLLQRTDLTFNVDGTLHG